MEVEVVDDTLSISPRKAVAYTYDTSYAKEVDKLVKKQQCEKLASLILAPGGPIEKLKSPS